MTYADFHALCKQRRSIRYFSDKQVSKQDIMKLLDVAHLAPSVENLQPWKFHVILNKDMRHTLSECSYYGNFVEGAGALIVVTCNRSYVNAAPEPVWNEKELEYSCMAAMSNILHGATTLGMGSCMVSLYRGKVHEFLRLPDYEIVVGGIMIGHFRSGEDKSNAEHERRPVEEMCQFYE